MNRYGHFIKSFLDRIVLLAVVVLLPLTAGNGVRPSAPPPPRFTPANVDAHVVAVWNVTDIRGPRQPLDGTSGDAALISKSADAGTVAPDGVLHYSVSVTNATNITQTFRVTDTLPASVSYVPASATGGFVYSAATASLTATTQALSAFHGDVITVTGAPTYTELIGRGNEQNICQQHFPVCDDNAITINGSFFFRYLGVDYSAITVDSNGFVVPGFVNPNPGNQNQHLPDANTLPNNVIAPFWADLDLNGSGNSDPDPGDWLYAFLADGSAIYLVVEWHNAQMKSAPNTTYSFQVWIQLFTEHITFAYESLTGNTSPATIGFENSNGTLGHSYLYNGAGSVPGPGTQLQVAANFATAQLGFDVQGRHDLRGCRTITNVVDLSNGAGDLAASASAVTNAFGPCLYLPNLSR